MITATLSVMNQTRRLGNSVSTGVYDDGELEALLVESTNEAIGGVRGTQFLSPEMLARILAGEAISPNVRSAGHEPQP